MMNRVTHLGTRKILDSAGEWTIEAKILLSDGRHGTASVPSGISEGKWEAVTVSANEAVSQIEKLILPKIIDKDFSGQSEFDAVLEDSGCGANATLSLSLAFCRAAETLILPQKIIFPQLMVLLFEGGKHGSSSLSIQEFLLLARTVEEGREAYQKIKNFLKGEGLPVTVGAEGGFSPPTLTDKEVLSIIKEVLGKDCRLGLDIAASSRENLVPLDYAKLVNEFPIVSLEDIYTDDDWEDWRKAVNELPNTLIVADDLTATNGERIKKAAEMKAAGAIVIKPDQRGTLTEVLAAVRVAKDFGLKTIVSHRGEETNDAFIVDLALACSVNYVKFGGFARGERMAKYNRLLEISWKNQGGSGD